jgi:hypothetical protein
MTVAFLLGYKKGNHPAVLLLPSLAKSRARQCRRSCFPLRLVFGQPATSPSLLLLRPLAKQAVSPSSSTTSRRSWKKIERRTPACIADHTSVRGDVRVPPLDASSDVPLHRRRSLPSCSFPCTHSSSASSWTALRQWGEHYVSFAPSEFSLPRSVSEYIFNLCNLGLIRRFCSNLVVKSRDEILFKGGGLWRPRFSAGVLTLMSRSIVLTLVKRRSTWAITSKTSPTTPNDTPWTTHGQGWVKILVKPLKHPLTHQCQPELLPRSPNFT